ncbi:hypothetical protein LCGC14_1309820 [marine sediment metagenome]|uniref:Holin n=1 Tax=marine sediment metagenome TaxID=412755 RepID=A0A0F9L7K9_9ZZZZ
MNIISNTLLQLKVARLGALTGGSLATIGWHEAGEPMMAIACGIATAVWALVVISDYLTKE